MSIRSAASMHKVALCHPPGDYEGTERRCELECDVCGPIGAAETVEEAQAIALLHQEFIAVLVEIWKASS